jgi:putative transposase
MRRMDELQLEFPFAGSRMLRDLLNQEGIDLGRRPVSTLMRRMGLEALYRKPSTSKPTPGHKIYPYLLRGMTIDHPNPVWAIDITYVPMARGFVYLAAVVDWFSRRVLSWRVSITLEAAFCVEALEEALARQGSRMKVRNHTFGAVLEKGTAPETLLVPAKDGSSEAAWRPSIGVNRIDA